MYGDVLIGAPEWIRTTDRRLRRPVLYPAELRAHVKLGDSSTSLKVVLTVSHINIKVDFNMCLLPL